MIGVGILGMGGMGWFHTTRYLSMPDVNLVAIADRIPEKLLVENYVQINFSAGEIDLDLSSVKRYTNDTELFQDEEIDVIDICLPTGLHAEYTVKALGKGKHVLCEKPMALTVIDANKMIEAAKTAQRKLMVAQAIRFWPEYIFLQRRIADGSYGDLRSLNMWRIGPRPAWSPDNWFLDPARSGGAILDLHIHDVDYVNSLFGPPDNMTASGRLSATAKSYDVMHALFSYHGGPQVHMHAGWSAATIPFQSGFEAWFDQAFIRFSSGQLDVYNENGLVEVNREELPAQDGFKNEITYFLECVRNDEEPARCTPESTRDSMILIEQELAHMRESQR